MLNMTLAVLFICQNPIEKIQKDLLAEGQPPACRQMNGMFEQVQGVWAGIPILVRAGTAAKGSPCGCWTEDWAGQKQVYVWP